MRRTVVACILGVASAGLCAAPGSAQDNQPVICNQLGCSDWRGIGSSSIFGGQQNYIPVTVGNRRELRTALDSGYVNFNWECPANLSTLARRIVDRSWAGLTLGQYSATYAVKTSWTGNGRTIEGILFSFEYRPSASSNDRRSAITINRCGSIFPQNMNMDTVTELKLQIVRTSNTGLNPSAAGALSAMEKISGLFLSAPLKVFTYASWAFTGLNEQKASINGFLSNFDRDISSEASITITPEDGSLTVTIDDQYRFTLRKTALSSLTRRNGNVRSGFEQFFQRRTGISLAAIRTGISSSWEADMRSTDANVVTSRCNTYRQALYDLGLTTEDVVLLYWDEIKKHTFATSPACFTPDEVALLKGYREPYAGAFGTVVATN